MRHTVQNGSEKTNTVIGIIGLFIAACSCVAAWIVVPGILPQRSPVGTQDPIAVAQNTQSPDPTSSMPGDSNGLQLELNRTTSRYTETNGSNIFDYKVPASWADYVQKAGLAPLSGNLSVDLDVLNQECFGQYTQAAQGACTMGEQLAWDCKVPVCTLQYSDDPQYCALEYCNWSGGFSTIK